MEIIMGIISNKDSTNELKTAYYKIILESDLIVY